MPGSVKTLSLKARRRRRVVQSVGSPCVVPSSPHHDSAPASAAADGKNDGDGDGDTSDSSLPMIVVSGPAASAGTGMVDGTDSEAAAARKSAAEPPLQEREISSPAKCPICNYHFTSSQGSQDRAVHVNAHFVSSAVEHTSNDDRPHALADTALKHDSPACTEPVRCPVCNCDLAALSEERRTLHLNRCLDEAETPVCCVSPDQGKTAAPGVCPICGVSLERQAHNKWISHLKRCAQSHSISAAQLITMVRGHLPHVEVVEPRLKATNVHETNVEGDTDFRNTPRPTGRTRRREKRPAAASTKATAGRRSKRQLPKDEDMQVAMALSASLAPQTCAATPPKARKLTKAEAAMHQPAPALLLASDADREKIVSDRVLEMIRAAAAPAEGIGEAATEHRAQSPMWSVMTGVPDIATGAYRVPGVFDQSQTPPKAAASEAASPQVSPGDAVDDSPRTTQLLTSICAETHTSPDFVNTLPSSVTPAAHFALVPLLLEQLKHLQNDSGTTDTTLSGTDGSITAHAILLRARCSSDTITAALQADSAGTTACTRAAHYHIEIPVPVSVLLALRHYVYTGEVSFAPVHAADLAVAARTCGLDSLEEFASTHAAMVKSPETDTRSVPMSRTEVDHLNHTNETHRNLRPTPPKLLEKEPLVPGPSEADIDSKVMVTGKSPSCCPSPIACIISSRESSLSPELVPLSERLGFNTISSANQNSLLDQESTNVEEKSASNSANTVTFVDSESPPKLSLAERLRLKDRGIHTQELLSVESCSESSQELPNIGQCTQTVTFAPGGVSQQCVDDQDTLTQPPAVAQVSTAPDANSNLSNATVKLTGDALNAALVKSIKQNGALHLQVLQYIPIDISKFKAALNVIGVKCSAPQLVDALNHEGITYYDATQQGSRQRKQRSRVTKHKPQVQRASQRDESASQT